MSLNSENGQIDWSAMATEERYERAKQLYTVIRQVAGNAGEKVEVYALIALGPNANVESHYVSNMRRGRISAERAATVHAFLEAHHFKDAQRIAPELFQMTPGRAWDRFLEHRRVDGGLRIVRMKREFGIVQRAAKARAMSEILQFGEEFCLELTSDWPGHAVAFQGYRENWHPVALGSDEGRWRIPITEGVQLLPRDQRGQPIPLVEYDDAGNHSFVVITSPVRDLPTDQPSLALRFEDERLQVFRIDVRFVT